MERKIILAFVIFFFSPSVFSQQIDHCREEKYYVSRDQCEVYSDQLDAYIKSLGLFSEKYPWVEISDPGASTARMLMKVSDTLNFLQNCTFFMQTIHIIRNVEPEYDCGIIEIGYKTEAEAKAYLRKALAIKYSALPFDELLAVRFKCLRLKKNLVFVYFFLRVEYDDKIQRLIDTLDDWKPAM